MARKSAAQRRYEEQVARRAQARKAYKVTIICADLGRRETVTVEAVDERLARTEAMFRCTMPLRGEHVEYDVREV